MKKELRIGNWVLDVDQPHQVTGIDNLAVELQNPPPYTASHPQLWEFIKPIPLTEEWLLKFGLKNTVFGFQLPKHQESGRWIIYKHLGSLEKLDTPFLRFDGMCDIHYVHQLQNFYFALTGTELTLND